MTIGKNVYIHPTAVIGENVTIEDDVYIGPLCIIGYPPEWKGKEDIDMGVLICKGARLTGLVTVDSGAALRTVIGPDTYLLKHSHIGHDAVIGQRSVISCGVKVGGHAVIGYDTNLGLNSVIHQKVRVPNNCMIGASAFIGKTTKMQPHRKYAGVPAREIGVNYPEYTINMKETL